MTPRWIQEVRIDKNAPSAERITIDGEPLPFYITDEPLRLEIDPTTGISTVYLGLMADRVVVQSLPSQPAVKEAS